MFGSFFTRELLAHKFLAIGMGVTALAVVASGAYYYLATRAPASENSVPQTTSGTITASGIVEPVQNPVLSFEATGRVASVTVSVGDRVPAGKVLASLDVASLSASRASAAAGKAVAEAKLHALLAGPRDTDIAVREAAVNEAEQEVRALYASLPATISDAAGKAAGALAVSDVLFSNSHSVSPTILFSVSDSDVKNSVTSYRVTAGVELSDWQSELATLPVSPSDTAVDAALSAAIQHLTVMRTFEDSLVAALSVAGPTSAVSSTDIASALASASAERSIIAGLIISLTGSTQTLAAKKLSVISAQSSLNELKAGASPEDIEAAKAAVDAAAANVRSVDAEIAKNLIVAPFPGMVASIAVKSGEIIAPEAPAITLLPNAALEVTVYVTEIDVGHLAVGDEATVTLDAYGAGRTFPATVASIDQAPSASAGGMAYKVELSFVTPSADIRAGMGANVVIAPHNQ